MPLSEIAEVITNYLELDVPPVALAFAQTAPSGIALREEVVPSACAFWRKAETSLFYAPAEKHFNCPVGAMTMGFALPDIVQEQLGQAVGRMIQCGYLTSAEPEKIPIMPRKSTGIVYGPLSEFPLTPDLVLLWLSPRQAMLLSEAVGSTHWTISQPAGVFGRPACAALPLAVKKEGLALSLGCTGMRTFTGVREDRLLAVLPGAKLGELAGELERTSKVNEVMQTYYSERQAQVASGLE